MKEKRTFIKNIIIILVSIGFYLAFGILDGPVLFPDSATYISMHISREPFYCSFLALNRMLFGIDNYLNVVVVEQSVLMGIAVASLVIFVVKTYKLSSFYAICVLSINFCVSLLCRFGSKTAALYSNTILTEAIAIPLFLIFVRIITQYWIEKRTYLLVWAAVLSVIMVSTRKQMYIAVFLLAGVILASERNWRKVVITIITLAFIMGTNVTYDRVYNYYVHGVDTTHTSDHRFLATMIFYTAEREDANSIEDERLRNLFLEIYDKCDSNDYMMHSAQGNLFERTKYFENHYDYIQIDNMWSITMEYVKGLSHDENSYELMVDQILITYIKALLPKEIGKIICVFFLSFLYGMVNTVSKAMPIMYIYSLVVWSFFIILLVRSLVRNKLNPTNKFGVIVLLASLLNVGVVALVIFCQTRYMIYNMPLFYIAFLLLFLEFVKERKNAKTV